LKKKSLILVTALISIIGIGLIAAGVKAHLETNLKQLENLPISEVNLMELDDGSYTGNYKVFPVSAEVRVTMNNHKITEIELIEHKNGEGAAAEVIPEKVVEAQTLDVDVVSGATYSSKVILKAIENALNSSL